MKPVFIIGYMCSGKTTFGKALASRLRRRFIDLDQYIESKLSLSVSSLFEKYGEEEFRKLEKEALREIAAINDSIIACGGGTPCFFDNLDIIKQTGLSVFLLTDTETLLDRLLLYNSNRPIVAGKSREEIAATISSQLELRHPFYAQADIIWSGENLDNEEQIDLSVEKFVRAFPNL